MRRSRDLAFCGGEIRVKDDARFFQTLQQGLNLPLVVTCLSARLDGAVQFIAGARVGEEIFEFTLIRKPCITTAYAKYGSPGCDDPGRGGDTFYGLIKILIQRVA